MMRPRWIPIAALLLFALLLSGCINIQQEYWLYEDGSAKVGMDIGMSEALLSMGAASGSDTTTNPFEELKNEYNDKNPNIKNVKVREYTDNDLRHFEVTFEVIDFNKFLAAESAQGSEFNITLTRTPDDNIVFKQITRLDMGSEAGSLDMESLGSVFENMYWSVIVHVPQVISTNGERVNNSTVQWKIPMADIFAGKAPDELSMVYEPRGAIGGGIFGGTGSAGSNWVLWLIVGTVLLAGAAGAAYYFLVYRKRTAPASAAFGGLPPEAGYPPQWGAQAQPGYPGATPQQPLPAPTSQTPPAYPPSQEGSSQPPENPPYPQYTQAPPYPQGPVQGSDYYPTYPPRPVSAPPPVEPPTHQPDQG